MAKTVILTNAATKPDSIRFGSETIRVLADGDAELYLGRKLSTKDFHTEVKHRISRGWAAFGKFKDVLCNRRVCIRDRVRFFDAAIVPCILYACGTWTLTTNDERLLVACRRMMLRYIVGVPRRPDECWVDFIQRATHDSAEVFERNGSIDWITLQRRRKWQLAAKIASSTDCRWARRLLLWRPWFGVLARRSVGHPCKRWDDDITEIAGGACTQIANCRKTWELLVHGFVNRL